MSPNPYSQFPSGKKLRVWKFINIFAEFKRHQLKTIEGAAQDVGSEDGEEKLAEGVVNKIDEFFLFYVCLLLQVSLLEGWCHN